VRKNVLRVTFVIAVVAVVALGLATPPLYAAACPSTSCTALINACNQLCGVQGIFKIGTCTAPDGSTKDLWVVRCPCIAGNVCTFP
jgi:hypothetical protein